MSTGVIIGRFQVPELHKGHKELIKRVMVLHEDVVVLLGVSPLRSTKKNPLTYQQRSGMIGKISNKIQVLPVYDCKSDEQWSEQVDQMLPEDCTLYGSRDSFAPYYSGIHTVCVLPEAEGSISGTEARENVVEYNSKHFRSGVIVGAKNRWINAVPCVDIAIVDYGRVLLGRKETEDKFRFIGGFVDAGETYEAAAIREVQEETKLIIKTPRYLHSYVVDDWRYAGEETKVTTSFFMAQYNKGEPIASDDIAEVRWFNIRDEINIVSGHKMMLSNLRGVTAL